MKFIRRIGIHRLFAGRLSRASILASAIKTSMVVLLCMTSCSKETRLLEPSLDAGIFKSWLFTGFEVIGDTIVPSFPGEEIVLNLHGNGRFDGSTNCNSYSGAFHFDPTGAFHPDSLRTTFWGCSPSSDIFFFPALEGTTAVLRVDSTLYLYYDNRRARLSFVPR